MVLLVSVVLCAAGFAAGKYWVGGLLKRGEVDTGAPRIVVETEEGENRAGQGSDPAAKAPPEDAQVSLSERAASEAEREDIEQRHPQDGAQLSAEEDAANKPDESVGSDTKPLPAAETKPEKKDTPGGAAAPAATGGGEGGSFRVVTGSFSDSANAQRELDSLAAKGFNPRIVKINRDGKVFHRVVVGTFDTRQGAEQLRDKLKQEGTSAAITSQ
jgi:cell division septation protein DedD